MNVAIIPARGGSKRIPRKNIRPFLGRPIIAYSIETAINSGLFDEVMVSTDDQEIATIAKEYGAHVPFFRSPETSNDHAGIAEVIREVLLRYEELGSKFDLFCCILPTAPLIIAEDLKGAKVALEKGAFDSVFPVVRFSYPIQRALRRENGRTVMIWPENYNKRSQDLEPAYHDCGQFYWMGTEAFLNAGKIFTDKSGSIELPEIRVQDIDTEEDWKICEMKHSLLKA